MGNEFFLKNIWWFKKNVLYLHSQTNNKAERFLPLVVVAPRSMTNFFKTLAVDAYLKSVETIKAEQTNVARMVVRYLANTDDANLLISLKETLADYLEVDSEILEVVPFYDHDDQWGIYAKYTDEYDDHCIEVSVDKIYEFAWCLCNF